MVNEDEKKIKGHLAKIIHSRRQLQRNLCQLPQTIKRTFLKKEALSQAKITSNEKRILIEDTVYSLDDSEIAELILNDLILSELDYLSEPSENKETSVLTILDQFMRDTAILPGLIARKGDHRLSHRIHCTR